MVTIIDREESHRLYRDLQNKRPSLFSSTPAVKYITDPKKSRNTSNPLVSALACSIRWAITKSLS